MTPLHCQKNSENKNITLQPLMHCLILPFYPFLSFCFLMWILDVNKTVQTYMFKTTESTIKQCTGKLNTY